MEHKFTITYKVDGDIPICPDWIRQQVEMHMSQLQADINFKKLHGSHKLGLTSSGPWFGDPGPGYVRIDKQAHIG